MMRFHTIKVITLSLLLTLFLGCSSSDESSSSGSGDTAKGDFTGQLIDSPIIGMPYECSSTLSGLTNAEGSFTCNSDDTITFTLGGHTFDPIKVQGVITPQMLFGGNTVQALNFAQLLQTLDSDGDLSNGITPDEGLLKALGTGQLDFKAANFDAEMQRLLGKPLVSEADAQQHLDESFAALGINADGSKGSGGGTGGGTPDTTPPSFTSPSTFNVLENQQAVGTITTDEGATLSISGVDAADFTLTGNVLTFTNNPDFESKSSYSLTISAVDTSGNTSSIGITVTLSDVDEVAPQFTNNGNFSAAENQTAVGQVTTDDATAVLTLGGADAAIFTLANDGTLTFNTPPDYEAMPTKTTFSITVTAQDSALNENVQTITITLLDLNEFPPTLSNTTLSITENSVASTSLGSVTLSSNGGAPITVYSLTGVGSTLFDIDSNGTITVSAGATLDYELAQDYTLLSTATNVFGESQAVDVTIHILNINDTAPVYNASTEVSIDENQLSVMTLSANDPDGLGETITYSVKPAFRDGYLFQVSGNTLSLISGADYEALAVKKHVLAVIISDGTNSSEQNLVVNILDVNEQPTAVAGADQNNMPKGTITLDATASSDPESSPLTYLWSFTTKPVGSTASLSDTGSTTPTFDADKKGSYTLDLNVSDGSLSSSDQVTITVINSVPIADAGTDQNEAAGTLVQLNGSVTDGDALDTHTYTWRIINAPVGSGSNLSDTSLLNPTFTPDEVGTYTLGLIINDGDDDSVEDTVIITTENTKPIANAGPNQTTDMQEVTLDGSASYDPNSQSITYQWTFLSVPSASSLTSLTNDTSVSPTFTPDIAGIYIIQLIVNDSALSSSPDDVSIVADDTLITHNGLQYHTTISPHTGKAWFDRNLGATQLCNALDDTLCYGDYYQWGRDTDNHEKNTSTTTTTRSTDINSAGTEFIINTSAPSDWVTTTDNNGSLRESKWMQTDGASICPTGYIVATATQLQAELTGASINTPEDAYASFLKIPASGFRDTDGDFKYPANSSYLWSSTTDSANSYANALRTDSTGAAVDSNTAFYEGKRAKGYPVRCVKVQNRPISIAGDAQLIPTGDTATLDGSGSYDPEGSAITYIWEVVTVPGASTAALSSTSIVNPTLTTDLDGDYVIKLIVDDGTNISVSDTVTITATSGNIPPVADAGSDQNSYIPAGSTNLTVSLDASGSSDVNGDALTYTWTFTTKPATSGVTSLSGIAPTFNADVRGTYILELSVTDATDTATDTITVVVEQEMTHDGYTYITITSPHTSNVWLDRNLGATQICSAYNDADCYGDYYQGGRLTDGHEKSSSATSANARTADVSNAGTPNFITIDDGGVSDWVVSGIDDDLSSRLVQWSSTDGVSGICPNGFRVSTLAEIEAEISDLEDITDAANSFLKIPSAGYKRPNGTISKSGAGPKTYAQAWLWANTYATTHFLYNIKFTNVDKSTVYLSVDYGIPVRCIQN